MLNALEDAGFNCIDNFPASLLVQWVTKEHTRQGGSGPNLAVCIDVRNTPEDLQALPTYIKDLAAANLKPQLIYLDADDAVLVKRFSDTRRRHPLDDKFSVLQDAIDHERQVLLDIAQLADIRIDTTNESMHDLGQLTKQRIAEQSPNEISLLFRSFGYKNGVPVDTDIVFDARCLPNPYWREDLRGYNGKHPKICEYLEGEQLVQDFYTDVKTHLERWLPVFASQHRVYITVGIGCTGGTHRSVYLVERLANDFRETYPNLLVRHRSEIA